MLNQALLAESTADYFDSAQLSRTVGQFLEYFTSEAPANVLTVADMCRVLAACERQQLAAPYQRCVQWAATHPDFQRYVMDGGTCGTQCGHSVWVVRKFHKLRDSRAEVTFCLCLSTLFD